MRPGRLTPVSCLARASIQMRLVSKPCLSALTSRPLPARCGLRTPAQGCKADASAVKRGTRRQKGVVAAQGGDGRAAASLPRTPRRSWRSVLPLCRHCKCLGRFHEPERSRGVRRGHMPFAPGSTKHCSTITDAFTHPHRAQKRHQKCGARQHEHGLCSAAAVLESRAVGLGS